tara:strand:+ start:1027 stop:1251 length:225 start_codon:yes stop_codon:yes gene_type:complete
MKFINKEKNKKFIIIIWKFNRQKEFMPAFCCSCCNKTMHKYNLDNKVFTFKDNNIITAINETPILSKGMIIKYS